MKPMDPILIKMVPDVGSMPDDSGLGLLDIRGPNFHPYKTGIVVFFFFLVETGIVVVGQLQGFYVL